MLMGASLSEEMRLFDISCCSGTARRCCRCFHQTNTSQFPDTVRGEVQLRQKKRWRLMLMPEIASSLDKYDEFDGAIER